MLYNAFFVRRLKRKVGRVFWDGRFIYVLPGTDCKQWSQKVARTATVINCLENLHSRQKPARRPFAGRHNNARLSVPWELLVYCGCTACIYCLQTADRGDSENLASSFSLYDTTQGRLSMKILKGGASFVFVSTDLRNRVWTSISVHRESRLKIWGRVLSRTSYQRA